MISLLYNQKYSTFVKRACGDIIMSPLLIKNVSFTEPVINEIFYISIMRDYNSSAKIMLTI